MNSAPLIDNVEFPDLIYSAERAQQDGSNAAKLLSFFSSSSDRREINLVNFSFPHRHRPRPEGGRVEQRDEGQRRPAGGRPSANHPIPLNRTLFTATLKSVARPSVAQRRRERGRHSDKCFCEGAEMQSVPTCAVSLDAPLGAKKMCAVSLE